MSRPAEYTDIQRLYENSNHNLGILKDRIAKLPTAADIKRIESKLDILLAEKGYEPRGYTEDGKIVFMKEKS